MQNPIPKNQETEAKTPQKQSTPTSFLRYSTMATQMGAIIGLFVFLGIKLDAWLATKFVFTLILSLFGVILSLYYFIKQVISEN